MYKIMKSISEAGDGTAIFWGLTITFSVVISVCLLSPKTFSADKTFALNVIYLSGLAANIILLLSVYLTKPRREKMSESVHSQINIFITVTLLGYAGVNAVAFSMFMIAALFAGIHKLMKWLTSFNPAKKIEQIFNK